MKNKIKIFLTSQAQFEAESTNLGEKAIFEELLKRYKENLPNAKIKVLSSNPKKTKSDYNIESIKLGGLINFFKSILEIYKSDFIVVGGGELIQDKSSLVMIPYILLRPMIGKLLGKKIVAQGVGIGEDSEITKFGKIQTHFALNKFDIITLRDKKSYSMLEKMNIMRPKIYLTADIANTLEKAADKTINEVLRNYNIKNNEKYVVLSMRSVYHRSHNLLPFSMRKKFGFVSPEYFKEIDNFKKVIARIGDYICENYKSKVVFIPAYVGKQFSAQDDEFSKSIMNIMKNNSELIIEDSCSINKGILSKSELVIGVPLHSLILAGSENIPVIAISYASKNRAYMDQIGMSDFVLRAENLGERIDYNKLKYLVDNIIRNRDEIVKKLQKKNKLIKDLSFKATEYIFDYIKIKN